MYNTQICNPNVRALLFRFDCSCVISSETEIFMFVIYKTKIA